MKATELPPDEKNQLERGGVVIRKGTVGAFIVNARLWSDPQSSEMQRADMG